MAKKVSKINAMAIKLFDEVVQEHFNEIWNKERMKIQADAKTNAKTIMEKAIPDIAKHVKELIDAAQAITTYCKENRIGGNISDYVYNTLRCFNGIDVSKNIYVDYSASPQMPTALSNKCRLIRAEIADCTNVKEAQEILKKYDIPFEL